MFTKSFMLRLIQKDFIRKMSTDMLRKSNIAVAQLTCSHDKEENMKKCTEMVFKAKATGCEMIFFPECSDYIGRDRKEAIDMSEDSSGSTIKAFSELAKQNNIWISVGGFHNRRDKSIPPYNTHVILNSEGTIEKYYDKLHQFNLDIPGTRLLEREFSTEGKYVVQPVKTPIGNIGLGICYDVRFPELSTYYRQRGAHILTYPAAFTVPTGSLHWEALMRARAIETQCYVVSSAQFGVHNPNRSSYGHAIVIDPNGAIIAQSSDKEDIIIATIDHDFLEKIRSRLNMIGDRRNDLYTVHFRERLPIEGPFNFGDHLIPPETVFYETSKSFAFVNLMPVTPGHVLVAPKRKVQYYKDLTTEEVCDLMTTTQTVQTAVFGQHSNDSTIAIQDGPLAGQTIPHTHVHIVPRRPSDFPSDDIYRELESKDKRQQRDLTDMANEAKAYRTILYFNA